MRPVVILAGALALAACGTKGPLYLVGEGGQRILRENQPGLRAPIPVPASGAAAGTASPTPVSPVPNDASPAGMTPDSAASPAVDVGPTVPLTIPAQ